jgi:hypothetical protein
MLPFATEVVCEGEPGDRAGGWGCVEVVRGWRVLDLHGTEERLGELYATLLRDELTDDWVPMNEQVHYRAMPGVFRELFVHEQRHFADYFDERARARAAGLEGVLALPEGTMQRYAWLADLGSIGPSLQLALSGTVKLESRCTSVVGQDGPSTVHARNLDYWGMGYWQPHATLTFVEPLDASGDPDGLPYAHVGTVGELFAGTTGVNQAGLVVSTHLHVTRDVALVDGRTELSPGRFAWEAITGSHRREGTAIYVLVEAVLREAHTVQEAVALLEARAPVGSWSFVLSDPQGGRAVVGTDQRRRHARWDATVNTNFYFEPSMAARELQPARGPVEGSRLRYQRATELLGDGALDVPRAVALLRDRYDAAVGHDRPVSPNSVLSPDTSQSVVIVTAPGSDPVLWLSEPSPDGYTPAPLAPFFALSFAQGQDGPGRTLLGEIEPDRTDRGVLLAYLDAMRLALDERDLPAAAARLRDIDTDDPGIVLMAALASASASVGEEALARQHLARFRPEHASHHHRVLADWLRGELAWRTADTAGARDAWLQALRELDSDEGPNASLDEPMRVVLADRLLRLSRGREPRLPLPFPDLKFQDVVALYTEGRRPDRTGGGGTG